MFDELLYRKGLIRKKIQYLLYVEIVLIRGDIIDMKINKKEAEQVWKNTIQLYFEPNLFEEFIVNFNHRQDQFDFEKYKKHFHLD